MADESLASGGVSWRKMFPFTHIFRTFRIAIHPSKLMLGLAAMILIFVGGHFLDAIWPVQHRVVPGEIYLYQAARDKNDMTEFDANRALTRQQIEQAYAATLLDFQVTNDPKVAREAAEKGDLLGALKDKIVARRNDQVKKIDEAYQAQKNAPKVEPGTAGHNDVTETAELVRDRSIRAAYDTAYSTYTTAEQIKNGGIFSEFFAFERAQFNSIVHDVKRLDWVDGYHSTIRFFATGPAWLLTQHTVYFFLFLILFAAVWAIFGGAVARIAAVHVARDEKLSIRAALRFSTAKFLSFLFAPIIPLLIVAALGIVLMIAAWLINIPFLGPIIAGIFFFLALAIGFVMALVLIGTVGGFNLMYPTIAVEGSDSFDAISRSFSYLYARPWRLAFYTIVAVAYGAITYTFLKYFITLMLTLIHTFIGYGVFTTTYNHASTWSMLWPGPGEMGQLSYSIQSMTLGSGETIGAYLIAAWIYLVIAILGAFAISFYFSSNTIIYYLMRQEVDATDMDDVFVEQEDDDLVEPAPPEAPPAAATPEPSTPEPAPQ